MKDFEIVVHRGVTDEAPENTLSAFQRAIELGADAIEFDVRLTSDQIPVVFHNYYLNALIPIPGAIFNYNYDELKRFPIQGKTRRCRISTLKEVLHAIGGQIGLEIEIKGPEPESAVVIAEVLQEYRNLWQTMEVTSYEPALLLEIGKRCCGLATDLLFPRSESWMGSDVIAYQALHRARLANARAVHLHPTQLTDDIVSMIRKNNIEIHAWDINDRNALNIICDFDIRRVCTDNFQYVFDFRRELIR